MINTPIYHGKLQSDLDFAGYNALNFPGGGGSGGGGGLPVTNIKSAPYNAAGDGVTDDTAALQAAINALSALGGGRIYFPPGIYLIGGALQDTSGRNAQILLPIVSQTSPPVTIEFLGALSPPTQYYFTETISPAAYSIIKSTLTGASGSAAFIAGKESGLDLWDNVQLIVRDIVFQAPPNPTFTAFNCFDTMGPVFQRVLIHTGSLDLAALTEPTNTNAVAIKMAPSVHSARQTVDSVDVFGFYTGLQDGELADNHINFWACKQGVLAPATYHMSTYRQLGLFSCARGIVAGGLIGEYGPSDGTHYMRVQACSIESVPSPAWQVKIYDVDDPSNLLIGDIKFVSILGGTGNIHNFLKNGGANLLTSEVGTAQASPTYIGTDARLVAISGGVKLEVRNVSTGTWVEATRYTNP